MIGFSPYVGSLHSSLKTMEMQGEFNRKKTALTVSDQYIAERQREIEYLQVHTQSSRKSQKILSIDLKLKSGGELTDKELKYLKEHSPELYQKAIEIIKERKDYEKQLRNAKTKEQVSKILEGKLSQFTTELMTAKGDFERVEQLGRRVAGIMAEHRNFTESKEYEEMPSDEGTVS